MNVIVLTGTLASKPSMKEVQENLVLAQAIIRVKSAKKTDDNETQNEDFEVCFWNGNAKKISEIEVGTKVEIRGRIVANNFTKEDGTVSYRNKLVAELVEVERGL